MPSIPAGSLVLVTGVPSSSSSKLDDSIRAHLIIIIIKARQDTLLLIALKLCSRTVSEFEGRFDQKIKEITSKIFLIKNSDKGNLNS
jgi:hypothetical protein